MLWPADWEQDHKTRSNRTKNPKKSPARQVNLNEGILDPLALDFRHLSDLHRGQDSCKLDENHE